MADLSLKERVNRRLEGLKNIRRPFESDAREIAELAQPARSRFLASATNKGRQSNKRLNNSHGIFAFRTLQGGMTSGLSSQSRPWFGLTTYDETLSEDQEVKDWLAEVERRMYAFLAQTNFYGAVKTGYVEMGLFGTEACVMVEHPTEGAVCHQLTFGEYWLGTGSSLQPEALYRQCAMNVLTAVQTFGKDKVSPLVSRMYDNSEYDEIIPYYQAIERNDEVIQGRMDWRGKPWRSLYWEEADTSDKFASSAGFSEQPFWSPRWDTTGGDVWGQGPGHDALPDLRELQLQTKRKAEATDFHIWPEMISSAKIKLKRQPKGVVSSAEIDMGKMTHVPYVVPYNAIAVIGEDVTRTEEKINQATFADLFMAITNMNGIQPRNVEEIASRNEEKLTQLGPVIERVNNEKLEVAIERVFGIMSRSELLPPAPESLRDSPDIKIEFQSILTQMQRMVGLGQIERFVGFVGGQAAVNPEVLDKIDFDEMVNEYGNRAGVPSKLIRTDEVVAELRDARQQQQQMEQAMAAAPAVESGAKAAQIMAEVGADVMPMSGAPMPL